MAEQLVTVCPDKVLLATEEWTDTSEPCAEEGANVEADDDGSSFDSET